MYTPWRIELFGLLRAEMDERVITRFSTHHTAALFARLALWPRRAHSREELVDLLWPDADFDAARVRLRQALASLRRQLEPPGVESGSVLIADRTFVRLNPGAISTDVADFEAAIRTGHLSEAITLYKGELLPGFYEEWILTERERLEARFEEIQRIESEEAEHHAIRTTAEIPDTGSGHASALPSPAGPVLRIPLQFTRFFGRQDEQEQIVRMLADYRLLTLTGPGGTGKTRLAIETARRLQGFQDSGRSIFFVELSEIMDGTRLPDAIGEALRLPRNDKQPIIERIAEELSRHPTLLILDNVEQVAAHAGPLILTLLTRVPSLRLLVTSRRRLHIAGEREYAVSALPLPPNTGAPEQMASSAAVQLFVDRAQTARPDFQLTPRNAEDIVALCRQLEGLPLALELAAARTSTMTPAQITSRLTQRFELLATRRTDKNARHRSLWATISWSVDLLPETLRLFWRQLSVFRDGCTAESAAAVTGEGAALESLTQLRERSLVTVDDGGGTYSEMRFRLLDSLREFGQEQMDAQERQESARRHGAYFLKLAQEGEEKLRGPEQAAWLEKLERDHNNLRAALTFGLQEQNAVFYQSLAGALWGFWERHGYLNEARHWLEESLNLDSSGAENASRALALNRLGAALNALGDSERAAQVHRETLDLYQRLDDTRGIALAWNRIGVLAGQQGHYAEAQTAFSEALARERELGNHSNMAAALVNLGILAQNLGEMETAQNYYAEGLTLFQELENGACIADVLFNLASISLDQERWEESLAYLHRAGEQYDTLGDRWSRAYVNYGLAAVARHQQRLDEAYSLAREALDVCQEIGDRNKVADILCQMGLIAHQQGDMALAWNHLQESLHLHRQQGRAHGTALCLRELAMIAAGKSKPSLGARLLGASEAWEEKSAPSKPVDPLKTGEIRSLLLQALGEETFQRLRADGYRGSEEIPLQIPDMAQIT